MKKGDCFEDEYETAYEYIGEGFKDGEPCVEAMRKFDKEIVRLYPEEMLYKVTYA